MVDLCRKYAKEYNSFSSMRTRCLRTSHAQYKDYGGRGIKICKRWMEPKKGFSNFLQDMGKRPDGCSLDRIDNDGPYSPENCRWATRKEQSNNTSTIIKWTYNGKKYTLEKWSKITHIPKSTLYQRVKSYGYSIEKALTVPYKTHKFCK